MHSENNPIEIPQCEKDTFSKIPLLLCGDDDDNDGGGKHHAVLFTQLLNSIFAQVCVCVDLNIIIIINWGVWRLEKNEQTEFIPFLTMFVRVHIHSIL